MNVDRNFIDLEIRGTKESISLQGDRNPFELICDSGYIYLLYLFHLDNMKQVVTRASVFGL